MFINIYIYIYINVLILLRLNRQGRFEIEADQLVSLPMLSKLSAVILIRKTFENILSKIHKLIHLLPLLFHSTTFSTKKNQIASQC